MPGCLMTNSSAMSALADILLTIPIDNRRCFTQRFSPTGFIRMRPTPKSASVTISARIQVKTYAFNPESN